MTGIDQKLAHDYTDAVFVGIGGCGINTISRLRKDGITGSRTVCINSFPHEQPIKGDDVVNFALNGGKNAFVYCRMPISSEACADAEKRIREMIKGAKKVLLFAGLGGFTGTTIAPVAAAAAKAEGATLGIVITLPFTLENKRRELAEQNYPKLRSMADDFVLRKNDDLVEMCPKKSINEAFKMLDNELAGEIKRWHKKMMKS